MTIPEAYLVFGGMHLVNKTRPTVAETELVVAALDRAAHHTFGANTVVISWADIADLDLQVTSMTGAEKGRRARGSAADLFDAMAPGKAFAPLAVSPESGTLVPVLYAGMDPSAAGSGLRRLHVYAMVQDGVSESCFIRLTAVPIEVDEEAPYGWISAMLDLRAQHGEFLNNYRLHYHKVAPGLELEHKLTLRQPIDLWRLTLEFYHAIRRNGFPGFVMEFQNHLHDADYRNFLFQITAPERDRGYVSFIPTTDGRNLVKQKRFTEDSLVREESLQYGVETGPDYAAYLRDSMGLTAIALPPFRRVRYDLQVESLVTGNVFGIFLDHVSLLDAPDRILNQVEIEYRRTRSLTAPGEDTVLREMATVADWAEGFLRDQGLDSEGSFYSKLSFLLDAVADEPRLRVR